MSGDLSPTPDEMTLRRLLHDVSPADFLSGYWGDRPLLVRRGQPLFYQHLLSLADIDTLLYAGRLRPGEYRLSQSGEGVDLQFRGRDEMNKAPPVTEFYRAFEQGQAIVIHGLHKRLPAMAVVTRELERALACPVTTNAYLSPPDGQAYPKHYDTHDFFIFQLHGTKRWRLFGPGNRVHPVRRMIELAERALPAADSWEAGPFIEEFDLGPGDLLYVPRGFGHEVVNREEISLHLTVALHGLTWLDATEHALARDALDSDRLRAAIPLVLAADGTGTHDLAAAPEAVARVGGEFDLARGIALWHDRYRGGQEPVPDGYWAALDRAAALGEATRLRRRTGLVAAVEIAADEAVLHFLEDSVRRPLAARPALDFLATADGFAVGAIPGLASAAERAGLAGELVRKGFLTIPPGSAADGPAAAMTPTAISSRPSEGGPSMTYATQDADPRIAPMSDTRDHASPAGSGGCGCASCADGPVDPGHVYAIGRINARFPSIDIEKELAQVVRSTETVNLSDREVLHQVLSQPDNAYIAREMCWVFSVGGVETFTILPKSGIELAELIGSLGLGSDPGATNVLIGSRSALSIPASACGGLSLPTVIASKIYSFSIDEFVKALPLDQGQVAAGKDLLNRITQLIDNVGDLDEHRAVNYLAMRYPAIYSLVVENYGRDLSLQGVGISPVSTRSQRRLVDVTLRFVSRKTDVRELYAARVDVTGMFPFMVSALRPVFEKD
ncbi:cupin domain-containing protein [Sphingomonas sp. ZT3P38]|uniref:cyanobactin maturation protease PatG family protein n=1 Tax=Parasphingomonas zepuensis TaxID=3096161 RepID=UPI002FC7C0A1